MWWQQSTHFSQGRTCGLGTLYMPRHATSCYHTSWFLPRSCSRVPMSGLARVWWPYCAYGRTDGAVILFALILGMPKQGCTLLQSLCTWIGKLQHLPLRLSLRLTWCNNKVYLTVQLCIFPIAKCWNAFLCSLTGHRFLDYLKLHTSVGRFEHSSAWASVDILSARLQYWC